MIRAAYAFQSRGPGPGHPGRPRGAGAREHALVGLDPDEAPLEIINARLSHRNPEFVDFLYARLQRAGLSAARRAAADQPGPQLLRRRRWWPWATPTAWSPA